ncbi:MAG: hypothetical protein L6N96_04500 [Candidatus Methylarchaceae archaeon HK02M2]|nr:hypothetical protein [Candidatus Methylarchaceae archaeon HK02M2]
MIVEPIEDSDWDFAKSKRVMLRKLGCEWSSSVFTVKINIDGHEFYIPNRDYPYEGLLSVVNGENWKFLDGVAFSLFSDKALKLNAKFVEVNPWVARYVYDSDLGEFSVQYYLMPIKKGCSLIMFFNKPIETELLIAPLVDLRHMYSASFSYNIMEFNNKTKFSSQGKELVIGRGKVKKIFNIKIDWVYKLYDGFREVINGNVFFKECTKKVSVPMIMKVDRCVGFACGSMEETNSILDESLRYWRSELENDKAYFDKLFSWCNFIGEGKDYALASRIFTLKSFRYQVLLKNDVKLFPEAGAWWFRTMWLRDVCEGLLNNYYTIKHLLEDSSFLREFIDGVLDLQNDNGFFPLKLPEKSGDKLNYKGVDGDILFLTLASKYAEDSGELVAKVKKAFLRFIRGMKSSKAEVNGNAILLDSGLITSCPNQSWIDSFWHFGKIIISTRIPEDWIIHDMKVKEEKEVQDYFMMPSFLLPEVNAYWIRLLRDRSRLSGMNGLCSKLFSKAINSFKKNFWDEGSNFLYSIVDLIGGRTCKDFSSTVVVSASVVWWLFSKKELEGILKTAKKYLVYRSLTYLGSGSYPFGLLVNRKGNGTYLGDEQYHLSTLWPRDTPYLIKLAQRLDEDEMVEGLLVSNLDHMLGENAIFYSNELFSLPEGINPYPSKFSNNLIPVKNPAQFWSHWIDPYINSLKYL